MKIANQTRAKVNYEDLCIWCSRLIKEFYSENSFPKAIFYVEPNQCKTFYSKCKHCGTVHMYKVMNTKKDYKVVLIDFTLTPEKAGKVNKCLFT